MVTSEAFTRMALALPDVVTAPHFARTAFKARTIFATLAADGLSAEFSVEPLRAGYVHELKLAGVRSRSGESLGHELAYYTLNRVPKE